MPSFSSAPSFPAAWAALAGACVIFASAPRARAETPSVPHPHAYGIIVGSNTGGAGQQPLRYAEDDAERVAAVLRDLGRFGTSDLRVLAHPDVAKILATVDELVPKLKEHAERGEQATFFFYYSGHAKASALTLGDAELPLAVLRERLRQVPSTLTLVVLDACQSGAFARTKGAEPAADFSFNSVARLTTKGIAVMASSTGQELSQESDALKSSYFTHHLVVALRGAGDADGDGKVSLDEAYRYAYRRTLAATARTRVGTQHATLETDLSGQGDVPVTYPADAGARLELPGALDARVLVQHRPSGSVVAELVKAPGPPLRLALPQGNYDATVRARGQILACSVTLTDGQVTALELGTCQIAAANGVPKGFEDDAPEDAQPVDAPADGARELRELDRWAIEGSLGVLGRANDDGYSRTLQNFDYEEKSLLLRPAARATLGVTRLVAPHLTVLVQAQTLTGDSYERTVSGGSDTFEFQGYGAGAYLRAHTDVLPRYLQIYGQAGGGASMAMTTLTTGVSTNPRTTKETQWGYLLGGAAGVLLAPDARFGGFAQASYEVAPAMVNNLGERHDLGGFAVSLGLRVRLGGGR
jgi:Caspase domain